MNLSLESRLKLVPLEIREDKKHYIVEDLSTGEFYEMPVVCIEAIQLINAGTSLGEIESLLQTKYPEEEADLIAFAEQLRELQLVAEVDGIEVEVTAVSKEDLGFTWISPKLGRFFFNKISFVVYVVLFLVNIFLFIIHPSLFPHYKDLFIFHYMTFNIPAWMLLSAVLVCIHEFGHVFAVRAQNLPTRLEIGHRLFLVVVETDMSAVWKLPSKDRNVLYVAGLCFDTLILSIALGCQLVFADGSGFFISIMNVVVLDTFIRMVYQLCIYMKTDLYYLFENITGCYNLMENAQQLIRKWLHSRTAKQEVMYEGEKNTIALYSIFYFIGVVLSIGLFVLYYLPQLLFALKKVLPGFSAGMTTFPFWDAVLFSLQLLIGLLLLLYAWQKSSRNRAS